MKNPQLNVYKDSEIKDLMLLRYWQQQINEILKNNSLEYPIPVHLGIGHEALALAVSNSLDKEDILCLSHRNCTYNLACSKSLKKELNFYNLNSKDFNSQMGSMNLAMNNTNIIYSSSILGNNLAVGLGIAFNKKISKKKSQVYILTGDGAIEEGIFWESLLIAKTHALKTLIIIENNNFSLGSTIEERRCVINFEKICDGLDIPFQKLNGNKYPILKDNINLLKDKLIKGPAVVEVELCTFNQHAGATPGWETDPKFIDIKNGLIIEENPIDPLYELKVAIGENAFNRFSYEILKMH